MSGECDDCGNTMCVCSEVERQRQAARPTITVDLETLEIALLIGGDARAPKIRDAREYLSNIAAERRRKLNEPAPGPWEVWTDCHGEHHLHDADGEELKIADCQRAAMAPELADALRICATHHRNSRMAELLARFDNPSGSPPTEEK